MKHGMQNILDAREIAADARNTIFGAVLLTLAGCATQRVTNPERTATEQFSLSRAVAEAVEPLNFDVLHGRKVYLDKRFFGASEKVYAPARVSGPGVLPCDGTTQCSLGKETSMKTIQSQLQNDDLRGMVERIVGDLESSHTYEGRLVITRVEPPPNASPNTPAGYPHLTVEEQRRTRLLGLIPHDQKVTILMVKEGFYDVEDTGRKDMFVVLKSKSCEVVAKRHLEEYGARNQVTAVVYKS